MRLSCPNVLTQRGYRRIGSWLWQVTELNLFIAWCLQYTPRVLAIEPVKIPVAGMTKPSKSSGCRTILIAEMGLELSRLPPRTAYVHVLQERDGIQVVRQAKIQTLPLDPPHGQSIMDAIIERSHAMAYKPREAIEAEIRERQGRWRRGPGNDPPPTHTGGTNCRNRHCFPLAVRKMIVHRRRPSIRLGRSRREG